jgi:chitin disaccharide deacetylase
VNAVSELAERLRFRESDRVAILSGDLLGSCHAANVGVYESMRMGKVTTSSIMVPCPWARHAAAMYRGEPIGVHLTLNAELDEYRWGPITYAPSLWDGDGGFPRTLDDVWDHGDLDEVRRETRSQLERAVLWGFDVTHLTSHLGALEWRPEFFDVYLDLAVEFQLPVRLPNAEAEALAGFPMRQLAHDEGVLFPDRQVTARHGGKRSIERAIEALEPGVTEIVIEPAADTPELRALDPQWASRVEQLDYITRDSSLRAALDRSSVKLISYAVLRAAQRNDQNSVRALTD